MTSTNGHASPASVFARRRNVQKAIASRVGITPRQDAALVVIRGIMDAEGRCPDPPELGRLLGIRQQSAKRLIDRLHVSGRLELPTVARMRTLLLRCDDVLASRGFAADTGIRRDIAAVTGGAL